MIRTIIIVCSILCVSASLARAGSLEEDYAKAQDLFEKHQLPEAEAAFKDVIERYPAYAQAYNSLGLVLSLDDKRIKESVSYFTQAIKLSPRYADPFANLGIICYKIGQFDRAEKYVMRAIDLDPREGKYYFILGWNYVSGMKNNEKGLEALKRCVEIDPDNADAHYLLGLTYIDIKKKENVFEEITALRSLNKEALAAALEEMIRTPYDKTGEKGPALSAVKMTYDVTMVKADEDKNKKTEAAPLPRPAATATISGRLQQAQGPATISGNAPRRVSHARIRGKSGTSTGTVSGTGTIQLQIAGQQGS